MTKISTVTFKHQGTYMALTFKRIISNAFSIILTSLILSACGGGGGATNQPTTVTITCPNGASKTAATLDLANTQCASPTMLLISPVNNTASVSVDVFTSIDVTTDSTLDISSLTSPNVALNAGLNSISGTVSAVGSKAFKFTPSSKLNYGQSYAFSASVKDTLGKTLVINIAFTTASVSCVAPQVPNSTGDGCVTPITFVCPNGASKTAATLDLAKAMCEPPQILSMSPLNGSAVSVDTFNGINVVTDSTLDSSSITNLTVTLSTSGTSVVGTASAVSTFGFKFMPTSNLGYAQTYTFSAAVKDTMGRTLSASSTFTTAAAPIVVTPTPTVTLNSSLATVYHGDSVTLTWSSTNATSCTASGGWSGSVDTSGTQLISASTLGTLNFSIVCSGSNLSANASSAVVVAEKPFFTEMPNAFDDPNTVLTIGNGVIANFVNAVAVDLNNDGKSELVLLLHNWTVTAIIEPCPNRLAIFSLDSNNKFVETTSQYIVGSTNINSCGESFEVVDINRDGKLDIIFATEQTDGRQTTSGQGYTAADILRVPGNLIGFVSQPNGKWILQTFGPPDAYYNLALGTNAVSSTFITAGTLGYTPRNNQYIYQGGNFVELTSTLPNISSPAAQFLSTQSDSKSDILIQASPYPHTALDAYLLDINGNWNQTDSNVSPYPLLATETAITTRGTVSTDVVNINGTPTALLGLDGSCRIKLTPSSRSIAVIRLLAGTINNYIPGQVLYSNNEIVGTPAIHLFGADAVDGKVKMINLNILGENLAVNYNFIVCKDINGDGYDDIVLYDLSSSTLGAVPVVYLNNQNDGFARLSSDIFPKFDTAAVIGQASSIMADFTGDGVNDIVYFPLNLQNNVTNLNGSLRLFKGNMPLVIK